MQLYAFNQQKEPVAAHEALRHCHYLCPECGGEVRLRGGYFHRLHFWHSQRMRSSPCRQSGKGWRHLAIQQWLLKQLPAGQGEVEVAFPSIRRVADLAWHEQKLVVEVQCSPMSGQEAIERTKDYRSVGYELLWLLDSLRYRGRGSTELEKALIEIPHYYAVVGWPGEEVGLIDLLPIEGKKVPQRRLVEGWMPLRREQVALEGIIGLPRTLRERSERWPLHLGGDWLDPSRAGELAILEGQVASKQLTEGSFLPSSLGGKLRRGLRLLFELLLQQQSR